VLRFLVRETTKPEVLLYENLTCFGSIFVCFGSIGTPKHAVSIKKRNNRNKPFVSDCVETSFGSFESKLASRDTLLRSHFVVPRENILRYQKTHSDSLFEYSNIKTSLFSKLA
jgi:hypothetical protein